MTLSTLVWICLEYETVDGLSMFATGRLPPHRIHPRAQAQRRGPEAHRAANAATGTGITQLGCLLALYWLVDELPRCSARRTKSQSRSPNALWPNLQPQSTSSSCHDRSPSVDSFTGSSIALKNSASYGLPSMNKLSEKPLI